MGLIMKNLTDFEMNLILSLLALDIDVVYLRSHQQKQACAILISEKLDQSFWLSNFSRASKLTDLALFSHKAWALEF